MADASTSCEQQVLMKDYQIPFIGSVSTAISGSKLPSNKQVF